MRGWFNSFINTKAMFPFSIKFSKQIGGVAPDEYHTVLENIKKFIEKKSADNAVVQGNKLAFSTSFLKTMFSRNLFAQVEKGEFTIFEKTGATFLTYTFSMYRILIAVFVMCAVTVAITKALWLGVYFLLIVGGMNWTIAIIRHRKMFNTIIGGINSRNQTMAKTV